MKYLIRTSWWKWLTIILLVYTLVGGLLMRVPRLPILNETVRNLHFHVPMWFGMIFLFLASCIYSIRYLRSKNLQEDIISCQLAEVGVLFGILGILTGMFWAKFTWGEAWSNDPKQNASAIALLIYFALLIFRGSLSDDHTRARLSSVYNIFAFAMLIPLLFILPRMTDSLHPGNGGNPGFNAYDLDNNLRLVFYAAVLGWTFLGFWIAVIKTRIGFIEYDKENE
jgi:heme exporter protein C